MPTPFDGITQAKALKRLKTLTSGQRFNRNFVVKKDHWQNGDGYIGPRPQFDEHGYQEFMTEVARVFVAVDAMLEILTNRLLGVIGKEPNFFWTPRRGLAKGEKPKEEEQKLIDEANALSTGWWNTRKAHQIVKKALFTMLWAERGGLRLYVPSGLRLVDETKDEDTGEIIYSDPYIEATDFEEALDYVWVDHPDPELFSVYEDEDTKQRLGVLRFERNGKVFVEICYHDADLEKTILRVLGSSVNQEANQEEELDIGARLTMREVEHPEFLTAQIRQMQRALNFAMLLIPHNMSTSAFIERTIINAQMPGDWQYYEDGPDKGKKIPGSFRPKPYHVGASTTNFLTGIEVESVDAEGAVKTQLTTPQVDRRDPAPVTPVIEGKEDIRRELFRMAAQEHLASKSDAEASGTAYEQKRARFVSSLGETAAPAAELVRWVVETKMAMAEDIMGEKRFTETLRVECQIRLDKGPVTADEQEKNWTAVEKNHLPLTEALTRNGVDDPDSAVIEINSQPASILAREKALAEVVAAWTTAGTTLEGALKRLQKLFPDLKDEDIADLISGADEVNEQAKAALEQEEDEEEEVPPSPAE